MTTFHKVIKYLAMAFAIFLAVSIIGGIIGTVASFSGLFDDDAVLGDAKTYTVSGDITELKIEIDAADFTIKQADTFLVESNLKHLTVKDEDGVLKIEENKEFGITYTDAMLILYIPTDTVFEKAEITTGAGRMTADTLSTGLLKLELGLGKVNIENLTATSQADIDGGAGDITISGGTLHNLDLDLGVGKLHLTSSILGNSDFDIGTGKTDITIIGNKDDYSIDAEKGIGNITIDGETVSTVNSLGNGENKIEISGGIGAIDLNFTKE